MLEKKITFSGKVTGVYSFTDVSVRMRDDLKETEIKNPERKRKIEKEERGRELNFLIIRDLFFH